MKRSVRLAIGTLLMLSLVLLPILGSQANAALEDGMRFDTKLYSMSRRLDHDPYTFSATLCLSADTEDGGVIISNYEQQNQAYITLEIVEGGNVKLKFSNTKWTSASYKNDAGSDGISEILFDACDVRTGDFVDITVVNETPVFKLYVDGVLAQTVTAVPTATETYEYYAKVSYRNEYCVGTQNNHWNGKKEDPDYNTSGDDYFKGTLKELAVYSSALTASEVRKLYLGGVRDDAASLIAHYDLEKYAGQSVIPDLSGNAHTLSTGYYTRTEAQTAALEKYAYSFAIVGDTQSSVYADWSSNNAGNRITAYIYDYIVSNKDTKNIKYVFGVGDITEKNNAASANAGGNTEWSIAQTEIAKLDSAGIPYSLVPGDHDKTFGTGNVYDYTNYNTALGGDGFSLSGRITGRYDQSGENEYSSCYTINNYYINFEVGETEYMLLALEVNPGDGIIAWANSVIAENPERRVIITTHAYLHSSGDPLTADLVDSHDGVGKRLWEELVSLHPNVLMVISGHVPTENLVVSQQKGVYGNTVTQILVNSQFNNANHATVAMLYFSEDGSEVAAELIGVGQTARSKKDTLYRPDSKLEFTLISNEGNGIYKIECIKSTGYSDTYRVYYTNGTYSDHTVVKGEVSAPAVIAEGECGEELSWTLTEDGILSITGKGMMYDFGNTAMPWYAYADKIKKVTVGEGVTGIGRNAFSAEKTAFGFTEISLPSTLTSIGRYAFYGCKALSDINIPDGVSYIGAYAFRRCGLTSAVLSETRSWAINGSDAISFTNSLGAAEALTDIYYSADLVGGSADESTVKAIAVGRCGKNVSWVLGADGVLTVSGSGEMYDFGSRTAPWASYKNSVRSVIIGEGITSVGKCAFYECVNITSVSLPTTLVTIGAHAFYGCGSLDDLTVPASVNAIGAYAFRKCGALTEVTFESGDGWLYGGASADISADALRTNYKNAWTRA